MDMDYGLFCEPVVSIYGCPKLIKKTEKGDISTISDEGLYGMAFAITGNEVNGFLPIRTHYGYEGYVEKNRILRMDLQQLLLWENSHLMVLSTGVGDVLSIPKVQGLKQITLYRGALVKVLEYNWQNSGWAAICLADGREGYIRNQFLTIKMFSQKGVWEHRLPQIYVNNETVFRNRVVDTALGYLGVPYRWGGKSPMGIDCSGLTSMAYMLQGVLIFRDAIIMDGYPVREISCDMVKKGDLLYFPGHIAMYIGDGCYIHSTGKMGCQGVVINSLYDWDESYRKDLAQSMYMAGSIF